MGAWSLGLETSANTSTLLKVVLGQLASLHVLFLVWVPRGRRERCAIFWSCFVKTRGAWRGFWGVWFINHLVEFSWLLKICVEPLSFFWGSIVRPAWSEGRSSSTSGESGDAWASALRFSFFFFFNDFFFNSKRKDEEEKKGGVSDGGEADFQTRPPTLTTYPRFFF